jgi:hypothetical protein
MRLEVARPELVHANDHIGVASQDIVGAVQAPGREGQVMVDRARQRDLLDLAPLGQGEGGRPPTGIAWVQGVEPVEVEVVQHLTDPVGLVKVTLAMAARPCPAPTAAPSAPAAR